MSKIKKGMTSPFSVKVTTEQVEGLNELVRRDRYPSISEAIRMALRDLIIIINGKY